MAIERDDPYGAFNFIVEIDGVAHAGFQEVSGLGVEIDVIEYRNGNDLTVRKLPGLSRAPNVVLKRGFTGSLDLFDWIDEVRQGNPTPARSVAISHLDEKRVEVARWSIRRAWPIKYEGPSLNARSSDIAIEELVLTHEGIELE